MSKPVVVLVHGAFAESASWNGVVSLLAEAGVTTLAVANPLRSLSGDATYVRDVVASLNGPVVLVGHSYGGQVITQAAAGNDAVKALVYVAAFTPEAGESALQLSGRFEGSTLGGAVVPRTLTGGGVELSIEAGKFPQQFAADVDPATAALMAVTQRPVTEAALTEGLADGEPAWRTVPSFFVWGSADRNIPAEAMAFMAERAGGRVQREIEGAGHALPVSQPAAVAETILAAVAALG
ncbi:alpha/beta fold hydrolase [Actinoplanes utahensis]|uniref:Alpha/beta hydrolase n=1 Tax=Actinoplanes utahensis TaxID=1869 RepID=A0A0A6USB9_ACTUT|nr:alpha/beta hydrolase [Actinoplanes utahensis]KHD77344.1 alpha/beta hydrolase [Actinoplanes utahensis]GIF32915.1 alpha/beta hydrolase [Actinoplanes utahensis]